MNSVLELGHTAPVPSPGTVFTCGQCLHYEAFFGMNKGHCHGLPPTPFPSGEARSPEVMAKRRSCSLFKPIPDGGRPAVKEKTDPETPGDAIKAARLQKRR